MEHVGEVGCLVAPRSRSITTAGMAKRGRCIHRAKTTRHWPLSRGPGKHSDSMFVFSIRSSYVALVVGLSNIYDLHAFWKSRRWYIVRKLCVLFVCN